MFENLSDRLNETLKKLRGQGRITEANIQEAMGEVRLALLEADVNFKVVKEFIASVTEKAVGEEVVGSLAPGQQIIKIVNQELIELLGGATAGLNLTGPQPAALMLVGSAGLR